MPKNLMQPRHRRRMQPHHEYELREVYLPRGTSRAQARRMLTEHAEYGAWELSRLRMFPDGSRRVILRRRIIRATLTIDFDEIYDA